MVEFRFKFHQGSNLQETSICSGNYDPVHRCIYAALGADELIRTWTYITYLNHVTGLLYASV